MSGKLRKNIGSVLMTLSFLGLLFIYYPLIKEYLFPPQYTEEQKQNPGFSVEIPSLKIFSKVIEGVDPFNKNEYLQKLKDGVAHASNTSLPGEKGTMYLFAHSSDVPWRITRYNTPFFRLGSSNIGDKVLVRYEGKKFVYRIYEKKEVWPNEVEYLTEPQGNVLVLQTCTPIGTALKRLLVFARPDK